MPRSLKVSLILLVSFALPALFAISLLLGTEGGTRLLMGQLQYWTAGSIRYQRLQGHLLGGLELHGLQLRVDGLENRVGRLAWRWHPGALLDGRLEVAKLELSGVRLELPAENAAAETDRPFRLPHIPLDIRLVDFRLDDFELTQESSQLLHIDQLRLQAALEGGRLQVQELELHTPQGEAQLHGKAGLAPPYPLDVTLDWSWHPPRGSDLGGQLRLQGDAGRLRIRHRGEGPVALQAQGELRALLERPEWEAQLSWPEFALPEWAGPTGLALTAGELRSSGHLDAYRVDLRIGQRGAGLPAADWSLEATGDRRGLTLERLTGDLLAGSLTTTGQLAWSPVPTVQLELLGQGLSLEGFHPDLPPALDGRGQLRIQLQKQTLHIEALDLQLEPAGPHLELSGSMNTQGSAADLKLQWQDLAWPLQSTEPLVLSPNGALAVQGGPDAYRMQLQAEVETTELGATRWTLQGSGDQQELQIETLAAELLGGSLTADGRLGWTPTPTAELDLSARGLGFAALVPDWPEEVRAGLEGRVTLDDRTLASPGLTLRLTPGETQLTLTGKASIADDPLHSPVRAKLQWHSLQWPLLPTDALVHSNSGSAMVEGSPAQYALQLETELDGADIPAGSWRIEGQGTPKGLSLAPLSAILLGGTLEVRGPLTWSPTPSWELQVSADGIDPAGLLPEWPGSLALEMDSAGSLDSAGAADARIRIQHLNGSLKGLPLSLSGGARIQGEDYGLEAVELASGRNRLSLSGDLRDGRLALEWKAALPQPGTLLPGAGGSLVGSGQVSGTAAAPRLQAELRGRGLALDGTTLQALDAALDLELSEHGTLQLKFTAKGLDSAEQTLLQRLELKADGTLSDHALDLALKAPDGGLTAGLKGALELAEYDWRGQLQRLQARVTGNDPWELQQPAALLLGADRAHLESACLQRRGGPGRACTEARWTPEEGTTLSTLLESLPLALFNPAVSGNLSADLNAALATDGTLSGSGQARLTPGQMQTEAGGRRRNFVHQGGELNLRIGADGLAADLELHPLERGRVQAQLALPALRRLPLPPSQPVSGRLQLELPDLTPLQALVPQLSNTAGRLSADLRLSGKLPHPRIEGSAGLRDASTEVPLAGLALGDIALELTPDPQRPQRLRLAGGVSSGGGRITLSGEGNLEAGSAKLDIQGSGFQLVNTPDARARLAPDLHLAWDGELLNLRGQLVLTEAAITPQISLTGAGAGAEAVETSTAAITPSPDVVVVRPGEEAGEARAAAPALPLDSVVDLVLGDAVTVDAVGFKSRIDGKLQLINHPRQPGPLPRAKGALHILDGTFRSFGQDLEIEWGRIVFEGGPITEPELDIRAVRWIHGDERVQAAGLHITGTPQHSNLEMFSRPQIDEDSIQAYLLTGRGPDSAERTLSIGTQLSSDFYVGYGINLLEGTHEFNLRYDFLRYLGMEADVGEADKSITFSYTLER